MITYESLGKPPNVATNLALVDRCIHHGTARN